MEDVSIVVPDLCAAILVLRKRTMFHTVHLTLFYCAICIACVCLGLNLRFYVALCAALIWISMFPPGIHLQASIEHAKQMRYCSRGDCIVALHRIGNASVIKIVDIK